MSHPSGSSIASPDAHRLEHDRLLARGGMAILLAPILWFVQTDLSWLAKGISTADNRVLVRTAMLAWLLFWIWRFSRPMAREAFDRALTWVMWGVAGFHLALSLLRPAGGDLPMRSALLVLAVMYIAFPIGGWRQMTPALAMSAVLAWLRIFRLNGTAAYDINGDLVVLVAFNAMGLFLMRRRAVLETGESLAWDAERLARDAAEKALSELRTLRGIIPICAHCKHVRTEAGAWQQVEDYIVSRTDADFSHGICPACLDMHYPEEDAPATA